MKIAVTYENGQVFGHFGHCRQFLVAEVENGQVIRSEVVPVLGSGHSALAGFLHGLGAEKLICGGIGAGARTALAQAGIELYPGVSGDAWQQYSSWLPETWPLTRTPPAIITMRKAIPAASMTAVSTPAAGITRANAGKRGGAGPVSPRAAKAAPIRTMEKAP